MEIFLLLPFVVRVALMLLLIVVLWLILRKIILRILSLIPLLLKRICWCVYLLIEMPIAALHKKFGAVFYKIDNTLTHVGEKVDTAIQSWYTAWHSPEKIHLGRLLLVYVVCVAFIILPAFVDINNKFLNLGETAYTNYETRLADWMEKHGLYDPEAKNAWNQDEEIEDEIIEAEDEIIEDEFFEIMLCVSGVESSLLVRDIPSIEDCIVLERLQNDDTVTWKGELIFAKADNDHIEPWVKVRTADDIEGWCRLFYLHPSEYEGKEFQIRDE